MTFEETNLNLEDFGTGIYVEGLFGVKCSIVNKNTGEVFKDFFDLEGFKYISFDEVSGVDLPMVELKFTCYKEEISRYINQGNVLRVYAVSVANFEKDSLPSDNIGILQDYNMIDPKIETKANLKEITITGILDALQYVHGSVCKIYKNKNSKQVFEEAAGNFFELDFSDEIIVSEDTSTSTNDIESFIYEDPKDVQNWIQGSSYLQFFLDLYMFTNYEDSFPVIGISANAFRKGKFKHRDFKQYVYRNSYKYKFVPFGYGLTSEEKSNGVVLIKHAGDITEKSVSGLMNLWRSCGNVIPVYNMDYGGRPTNFENSVTPGMLSGASFLNVNRSLKPVMMNPVYINSNMYGEAYSSKSRNMAALSLYSSQKITFSFADLFIPIEILDLIYVVDDTSMVSEESSLDSDSRYAGSSTNNFVPDVNDTTTFTKIDRNITGRYIVTRVSRVLAFGGARTLIEACRECSPEMIGNLVGFIEEEEEIAETK